MTRLTVGMIVFNDMPWIEGALYTMYPHASKIAVVEGPVRYWQSRGYRHSTDGTIEAIESFPDPAGKIEFRRGQWIEKEEMCNAYIEMLREYKPSHVWHVDADEFYTDEDIRGVLATLDDWDTVAFRRLVFVNDLDHHYGGHALEMAVPRIFRWHPGMRYRRHRPLMTPFGWGRYLLRDTQFHYAYVTEAQQTRKKEYYRSEPRGRPLRTEGLPIEEYAGKHPAWIEDNRRRITK